MNRKQLNITISSISIVLIIFIIAWLYKLYLANPDLKKSQPAIPLQAIKLQPTTINITIELPGRTVAYKIAEIRPQINGIIIARLFTEGSYVKAGQQLYQIDPALYQANYDSAIADLNKANANLQYIKVQYNRYKNLLKSATVSQQEFDEIEASLEQAKANIEISKANVTKAKINLDYTKVYAPISGIISKSNVTEGALVTANQANELATITVLDPIYVDMIQPSNNLTTLPLGAKVRLLLDNGKNIYSDIGTLLFKDITIDKNTDSIQLRALFPNHENLLLPGLFIRAQIELPQPNSLLIPQEAAIRQADGNLMVWKLDENQTTQAAIIITEHAIGGSWLVKNGIKNKDIIVIEGLMGLKPGIKIKPILINNINNNKEK